MRNDEKIKRDFPFLRPSIWAYNTGAFQEDVRAFIEENFRRHFGRSLEPSDEQFLYYVVQPGKGGEADGLPNRDCKCYYLNEDMAPIGPIELAAYGFIHTVPYLDSDAYKSYIYRFTTEN